MAWRKSSNADEQQPQAIFKDNYSEVVFVRRNFELKEKQDVDGTTSKYWEWEENKIPFKDYETFEQVQEVLESANTNTEAVVELAGQHSDLEEVVNALNDAILELGGN